MMNELVQRLSTGTHPVVLALHPEKTVAALKERIELGYIYIKFTQTQGGTALGVWLDCEACDLNQADFDRQTGIIHLVGRLILNDVNVRCTADIDLATMEGEAHLDRIEEKQEVLQPLES